MNRQREATDENDARRVRWSSRDLADGMSFAATHFEQFVPEINALNVFPVPDGDTGTNMFLTLQASAQAAQQAIATDGETVGQVLRAAAHGALMGARGNSGVILYQFFEGLAQSGPSTEQIDGAGFVVGLRRATELAYQAVINPVEGTMLTVIRAATDAAERAAASDPSVHNVLAKALDGARRMLERTPEMLPILRQAGVVDAGGKGLVVILDGLVRFTEGREPAHAIPGQTIDVASAMNFLDQVDLVHGVDEFGYCTNFLLTGTQLDVGLFREKMDDLGTSAIVVGTADALKVHVHSEHPGTILEAALQFGELQDVRIDNMAAQTRKLLADRSIHEQIRTAHAVPLPIAMVAVASGKGLANALTGMGANLIVDGGPTTNPSTKEILAAVERAPSDVVIILPNDPNVIATARHVATLTAKSVEVVPSRSVPQGISALSAFNHAADVAENVASMTAALGFVKTVAVTRASRDALIDGVAARQGEYIGLLDGTMIVAGVDILEVARNALDRAGVENAELLTVFTGESAIGENVRALVDSIEEAYPDLTIEVAEGDQPHYDLIMAVE